MKEEVIYNPREDLLAIKRFERNMRTHHEEYVRLLGELSPEAKSELTKADFFKVFERQKPWDFEKWHTRFDISKLQLSDSESLKVQKLLDSAAALSKEHKSYIHHVGKIQALMQIGEGKNRLFSQVWGEFGKIFDVLERSGVSSASRDRIYEQLIDTLSQDMREISGYIISPKQLDKGRIGILRLSEAITHAAGTEGLVSDTLAERVMQECARLPHTATKKGAWERLIKDIPSHEHTASARPSSATMVMPEEVSHVRANATPWLIGGGIIAAVVGAVALMNNKDNRRSTWSDRVNVAPQNNGQAI